MNPEQTQVEKDQECLIRMKKLLKQRQSFVYFIKDIDEELAELSAE